MSAPDSTPPKIPTNTKPSDNQTGLGRVLLDLLFNWIIPNAMLAKTLPGFNFGFKDVVGGEITSYISASLVPVAYNLLDIARHRRLRPTSIVPGISAVVGGALAFLRVEGVAFALKDSYGQIVLALVTGISLLIAKPFFEILVRALVPTKTDDDANMVNRFFVNPIVKRGLSLATAIMFVEAVAMGVVHFVINLQKVVGKFGTTDFNGQIVVAHNIMRPIGIATSLIAIAVAYALAQREVSRAYPGLSLFEDDLVEKLREKNV